jgi:molybdenum cofactor cytidylyltransferase
MYLKDKIKLNGLILAAGKSSRMGSYKPLLEYEGKSFIGNIISKISAVCDNIIVVSGFNSSKISESLSRFMNDENLNIRIVLNENYEKGMFSSLKKGVAEIAGSQFILYHLVDQPNLPLDFYYDFKMEINEKYDWIQPVYKNRKGHPVIFGQNIIDQINNSSINSDLRTISNKNDLYKHYWNCRYPQILTDLDTPEDVKQINLDK